MSVLNQTYDNIEYLIMDGGSTDNTHEIVRKYENDPRLKFYSQKDDGQYDAVNRGFMMARGEILGWINSDDIYTEDAVEKTIEVFRENPDVEVVYGKSLNFREDVDPTRKKFIMPFSYKWLKRYCFTNPSVTFIKADLIYSEGFLIDNSIAHYGDWDWFLKMAEAGKKFHLLPEVIGYFRVHPDAKTVKISRKKIYEERLMISKRHNIPLSYMALWIDFLVPWFERFQRGLFLLSNKKYREIINRFSNVSKLVYKNIINRLA